MDIKLLTPKQVSEMLSVDYETLNVWRATKRYKLPYVKVGSLVRYKLQDVQDFIESRTLSQNNFSTY